MNLWFQLTDTFSSVACPQHVFTVPIGSNVRLVVTNP